MKVLLWLFFTFLALYAVARFNRYRNRIDAIEHPARRRTDRPS